MGGGQSVADKHCSNHSKIPIWIYSYNCPLTLVSDQGVHFINNAIKTLIMHFLFKHTSSTTYYLEGNAQAKSTNKVIGLLFTKLVNEKHNDWDEHLHIILFAY
jgi:hypothetical protein